MHTFSKTSAPLVLGLALLLACPGCARSEDNISIEQRSAEAWPKLRKSYEVDSLDELLKLPDDEIDIATAALLIEKQFRPDVDVATYRDVVDQTTNFFLERMPKQTTPQKKIGLLNVLLRAFEAKTEDFDYQDGFLSNVLRKQQGNCLGLSTLYVAVGRRLGLPLRFASTTQHVFVRYDDGTTTLNIETLKNGAAYKDEHFTHEDPTGAKVLPHICTTPRQEVAKLINNRGVAWLEHDQTDKALADFTQSLALDPTFALVYRNRAEVWIRKDEYDNAIADCTRAIELDPLYPEAYVKRGTARFNVTDQPSAMRNSSREC